MSTAELITDFSQLSSHEMIVATLSAFCHNGVVEIRCLEVDGRSNRTDSGYFDDFEKAAKLTQRYVNDGSTAGVYFTLNPVLPELLARASNRFKEWAKKTTSDGAVTSRRWLYVDCDSDRSAGISSTDEQVERSLQVAAEITDWMMQHGLCEPITALSGNGAHLHFPIDLPNNEESLQLVSGVLRTLDQEFSDESVKIDQAVENAARICRLYGSIARKGDSTSDRPHRMARLIYVPDYLQRNSGEFCDVAALQAIAAMSEEKKPPGQSNGQKVHDPYNGSQSRFLMSEYLRDAGLQFDRTSGKGRNGTTLDKFILPECPFDSNHRAPDAYCFQEPGGAHGFHCSHNSCKPNSWQAFKERIGEPKAEHYDPPKQQRREYVPNGQRQPDIGHRNGTAAAGKSTDGPPEKPRLIFHDAWESGFKPRPMRECIIEGLLRRGEVGNVIASTKTGKSWFGLMLLMCMATGRDWLGRRVARGNVLLIDNELQEETIENRIADVLHAADIRHDTPRDGFEYIACRGDWLSIQDLIEEISERHPPGSLNLIVIDAKYRLFGNGLEENSNDDQTTFHNMIDKFAKEMNCPILLIHHATKGDQTGKSVTDVGSGGGSQSRAVDVHLTIRPHQEPELSVLEARVRSFAPVEPVTLRWNWPLWSVDADVEPVLLKASKGNDRGDEMRSRIQKYLTNNWQSLFKLAERCSTKPNRNPFADIIDELQQEGVIEVNESFIPKNSKTETTGVRMTSDKMTSDSCPQSLSARPD